MSSVVFRGHLAEHLRFGHVLEIAGRLGDEAKSIQFYLCTADPTQDIDANIGLYMLINFDKQMLTLKKLFHNQWMDEEITEYDTSRLQDNFSIYIVMAGKRFHIALNGELATHYSYGPKGMGLLKFLEIEGHISHIRQVDHRKFFPCTWPPIQVVEERLEFSNDVPMSFRAGHCMVLDVQLKGNEMGRFIIHMRNVLDSERQELHLSFRFDTKVVVCTSKTVADGEHYSFGQEERAPDFPFQDISQPFKLALAFTAKGFLLAKDGLRLFDYAFRNPRILRYVGGLKMFGIDGMEVQVSSVDHRQLEDASCEGFEEFSVMMVNEGIKE